MVVRAYGFNEFQSEANYYLSVQNKMIEDVGVSYGIIKRSLPVFSKYDGFMTSIDISYGEAAAPYYMYANDLKNMKILSDPVALNGDSALRLGDFRLNGGVALENNIIAFVNFGGSASSVNNHYNIGAELYYRLIDEELSFVGICVGGGYNYSGGSFESKSGLSYIDSVTNSWTGTMSGMWNINNANLELFIYKTYLIINFYSRITCNYAWGNVNSSAKGTFNSFSVEQSVHSEINRTDWLLSGGMEILLGLVGVNVEAGRDWSSGSVYGNIGIRTTF
ncbi:MAG: hypothetical protein D6714_19035 [Bacteroidetes bacterium]|nr:MAG: hypothetical protein D6714_19035 [Bacteroidota bacterium]